MVVNETLPAGTTFEAGASTSGWSCAGSNCTFSLGTLIAGASRTLQFSVRLPSPVPFSLTRLDNTACLSTPTAEPQANNCDDATVAVDGSPRLSITKTLQSGRGEPGSILVFLLTVANTGNRDSAPGTLTETVPAFTTAVASPAWTCVPDRSAGSTCTSLLPSIPGGGASVQRTFAVVVDSPLPQGADLIRNTACVRSTGSPDDCDDLTIPTDARAMISITKVLTSGRAVPGEILVYTLTVQNTGNRASAPVALNETVPDPTTFVPGSSSPDWDCPSPTPPATCHLALGSIDGGGATATRRFAIRVSDPVPAGADAVRNTACAEDSIAPPACDGLTIPLQASPVLTLEKLLEAGTPAPGQLITYSLKVSNTGNQHAGAVVVTDELPPWASPDPASPGPWKCSQNRQCSTTLPSLPAGTSTTLRLTLKVASPLPANALTLVNRACASDSPSRTVCDSVETPLGGSSELLLTKTYQGPPLRPGIDLPFVLNLSNAGDRDASEVLLREILPNGTRFQPQGSDPRWRCDPGTRVCELSLDLPAGGSAAVSFVLHSDSPLPAGLRQVTNTACAVTADGNVAACDDASTPLPTAVELTLQDEIVQDLNGNGSLEDGERLRYILVVRNTSEDIAHELHVTADLDGHLTLVAGSVSTSGGSVLTGNAPSDETPSVWIPQLAPGASVTVTFETIAGQVLAAHLSEVVSSAQVTGMDIETEPSDDPDTPEDDDPTRTPVGALGVPPSLHEIPTLSQWGLVLLSLLLAGAAFFMVRRRTA